MARTFEEIAGEEMDALFQGALFLSGGDAAEAERLVVDTVMLAFDEYATETDPDHTRRWFEARLVRSFLRRFDATASRPPRPFAAATSDPSAFDNLGPAQLFEAAAMLPPGPRAALWLVVLRRWRHRDAAEAMSVEEPALESMLEYRHTLMQELMARTTRRSAGGLQ